MRKKIFEMSDTEKEITENKSNNKANDRANMLGTRPVGSLLLKFAIPSIVAMLVSALYNMVDQIFIGNYVGELGNAATNIAFPFSSLCTAIALTFGIGGAAAFNLTVGAGDKKTAGYYIGNSIVAMLGLGVILTLVAEAFMPWLLMRFGSTTEILPYAVEYTRITAIGFPILILSIGGGHMIRADGKPSVAMICNLSGAITNTALDALFVIVFKWGMAGAAAATVIGQIVAAGLVVYNLAHFRTVKLEKKHFVLQRKYALYEAGLGMSQGFNQLAMMVVQIVLNNSLKYYGARSIYGENIPIAVVGVISKVNMMYFSFCIGISQGMQPISSFNYGAKNYRRTREAYIKAITSGAIISLIAFAMFQIFPRQITNIFGGGDDKYFAFAINYFRIYLFGTFINNIQPLTSNFFSSIGKPKMGLFLSLTRQILFLLPLVVIFPIFWGIDGIMYAGPIADGMAFLVSMIFIVKELSKSQYKLKKVESAS